MNSYERVMCALRIDQPDRVPIVEWMIHPNVTNRLEPGITEQEFMAKHLDAISTWQTMREKDCGDETIIDEWGVKRKYLGQRYPMPFEFPIKNEEDLRNYEPPSPNQDYRLDLLKEVVKKYKRNKAIVFCLETVFTYAWALVGLEELLISFKINRDFARKLLDINSNYHLKLAKAAIEAGADVIMCGDDLAYKTGLMMSRQDFERFLLPYYKKMIGQVHDKGAYFIKHTDGRIWEILDLLVDAGIDAINPLEPVADMNIGEVKKKYGDKVCLIGNIDCGDLLSRKSPREVKEVVKQTIKKAAPGGGYIISSSNAIHASVKPENYKAMIQATKKYGKYSVASSLIYKG